MIQGRIAVTGVGAPSWDASGILVSNGREVTTTTAGGSFELPRAPEDRFVTVTTPAGFDSDGPSYQRLTASSRYDFQLRVDAARGADTFSFVHITDIHLGGLRISFAFKGDEISVFMTKQAEFFMDDYNGFGGGRKERSPAASGG